MRALSLFWLLPVAVACSSSESAAPSAPVDAGPPTVTTEACTTRCVAKAQACGAPAAQAGQTCASVCVNAVTEAQAACLEAKSCSDLISAAASGSPSISTICPGLEAAPIEVVGPTSVPATVTIATAIPSDYLVNHTNAGMLRSSLFNVAGVPLFIPASMAAYLPLVAERTELTVESPPRNGCESVFNVTVTARQLAVSTSGVDTLPDTKCADFIDAVAAQGATLTLKNVPWKASTETSTVTIVLRKLSSN